MLTVLSDARQVAQLRQLVWRLSQPKRQQADKLPGPLAVTLSNATLARVVEDCKRKARMGGAAGVQAGYWVCEKSDGERAMLLCTTGPSAAAYLVNRSFVFSVLRGGAALAKRVAPEQPTLLDGELLTELGSGRTVYMIFDAINVNGRDLVSRPLVERLGAIGRSVVAPAKDIPLSACPLRMVGKEFFPVCRIRKVFDRIRKTRRGGHDVYVYHGAHGTNLNDGVVFTPGEPGYFQPRETLLKWKWFEDNTVDFYVDLAHQRDVGSGHKVKLQAWTGTRSGLGGPQYVHTAVSSDGYLTHEQFVAIDAMLAHKDGVVVEFGYDVTQSRWTQKCVRADKAKANHISVAWHTMEVMAENITRADLIRRLTPAAADAGEATSN